jgi:ABC-type phosphonate transport system ATPase subunit
MNEFQPRLVLDSRINDITDKIDIAVKARQLNLLTNLLEVLILLIAVLHLK